MKYNISLIFDSVVVYSETKHRYIAGFSFASNPKLEVYLKAMHHLL